MTYSINDITLQIALERDSNYLQALAMRLLRDRDAAMDLYQETWLRILENFHRYDNRGKFRSWASVIMRNVMRNMFLENRRMVELTDDVTTAVDDDAYSNLSVDDVRNVLAELPNEQATVFYMYLQGYTYEEMACRLDIPLGTVKSRLYNARTRLKSIMH